MFKRILASAIVISFAYALVSTVSAASFMPTFLTDLTDSWKGATAVDKMTGFIRLALTLAFGAVVLVAVVYSIMAAFKFIQSRGDAGQVEEANKAVKAIFQGVIAMFVGIIGIVIVFFIFDVALPDPNLPDICVTCPETKTCRICSEGTLNKEGTQYDLNGDLRLVTDCEIDSTDDTTIEQKGAKVFCADYE